MKILTATQCKALDKFTMEHEPIASIDLMERASVALAKEMMTRWKAPQRFLFFAGPGNNGGDALAVARIMSRHGYDVEAYLFSTTDRLSEECRTNLQRLKNIPSAICHERMMGQFCFPVVRPEDVIVDGLFGTGLSRPLNDDFARLASQINQSGAYVVSIDLPSGLMSEDNTDNILDHIVRARLTLTIHTLKPVLLFPENECFVGEVKVLPIGLADNAPDAPAATMYMPERNELRALLRPRSPFAHKGTMGHALLVSGSYGMAGASILAGRACLRSGVGKLTQHIPRANNVILQIAVPEAVLAHDPDEKIITHAVDSHPYKAVAIGPGIGTTAETAEALHEYLLHTSAPMVLDADALNLLGQHPEWIPDIPRDSILTPHPKELENLVGPCTCTYERMVRSRELAGRLHIYIIVKGHNSMICMPDGDVAFNPTGNAGMATAGSGDVLTGILLGLLARGYLPQEAALLGAYLHGLAGDFAADKLGMESMTAGDIVEALPEAFKTSDKYQDEYRPHK